VPDKPLPGSPPRPTPPPSRGFLNDLFPVDPRQVVGGLYDLGARGVGRGIDTATGAPSSGDDFSQPTLGREAYQMLTSPTFGGGMNPASALHDVSPVLAAAPLALTAKIARTAKVAEEAAQTARAASPLDAVSAEARAASQTPTVAETVAKRAKAPKDLPQVSWNPQTQTWEGGPVKGVPLDPPPHVTIPDIYDTKAPELANVPNVPQVELPRYEPAKGSSQRVQDLIANEAVREKMLEAIRRGTDVGMSWHNAQPAIQDAIDALGSEQAGRDAFKRYIDYNAATSSLNEVPTNLREASYYYWREGQDLPPPVVGETPPDPYHGGLANQGHQKAVNQILEGAWGQGDAAKTPSYGANLEGNLTPVAVDRHAVRAPAMLAEDPRWLQTQITLPDKSKYRPQDEFNAGNLTMEDALKNPTYWVDMPAKNEYAGLEDYYQDLGQEAEMAPGQAQASGWVGNAQLTGVKTDPNKTWLDMYQDRIKNTAYRTGKDPRDVAQGFWQRKWPLLAVGAAPVAATPIGTSPEYDDWWKKLQDQQFAGGAPAPPT